MPKHDHTAILQTVREELPAEELICDLSDLFKVFGDTTRMRILYSLFESELCVCAIAELLGMTQSAIRISSRFCGIISWWPPAGRAKPFIIFWRMTTSAPSSGRASTT